MKRVSGASGNAEAVREERAYLDLPPTAITIAPDKVLAPDFLSAVKRAFDIDTIEDLIRLRPDALPASFGADYPGEVVDSLRNVAIFGLEQIRRKYRVVEAGDEEIERLVSSAIIVAGPLERARRMEVLIEALEKVGDAGRDLAFELRRGSRHIPGIWPPWETSSDYRNPPPIMWSTPNDEPGQLPTMMRLMLPGIAHRLSPKTNETRSRLLEQLRRKYRAAVRLLFVTPMAPILRRALLLPEDQPLPEELPLSRDAEHVAVDRLALTFSSLSLALQVEHAQLPDGRELAKHRRGRVGAIPWKATPWRDLERWRKRAGTTYYRIAKVILSARYLRDHFDPHYDLDLTAAKLEKRIAGLLRRADR